jgi:hypothetical protein
MENDISLVGRVCTESILQSLINVSRIPNAGSFIRPSASVIRGVSFLTALQSKYIESFHGSSTQEKITLGSSNGAIEVEAVNLDKIRSKFAKLERLREVSLENEFVAKADPPGMISSACPSTWGTCDVFVWTELFRYSWSESLDKSCAKLAHRGRYRS